MAAKILRPAKARRFDVFVGLSSRQLRTGQADQLSELAVIYGRSLGEMMESGKAWVRSGPPSELRDIEVWLEGKVCVFHHGAGEGPGFRDEFPEDTPREPGLYQAVYAADESYVWEPLRAAA